MNNVTYFKDLLRGFDNTYGTRPYNFKNAVDRKEFVHAIITNKIYRNTKSKNIIHKIESDKNIKTYLYSVIENAAKTLIRYNGAQIRNPPGGIMPLEDKEIPGTFPEGPGKYIIKFETEFPILSEIHDFQTYPHIFFCHYRLNLSVKNFKIVENNQNERILKWRTGRGF